MGAELLFRDDHSEQWCADSLNPEHVLHIMGERRADTVVVDAPYSERTHAGHRDGIAMNDDRARRYSARAGIDFSRNARKMSMRDIDYASWANTDVNRFCDLWLPLCCGWCVSLTDHVLAPWWQVAYESHRRLAFAPLPLVEIGSRVRMTGDGPACWACWVVVARPRNAAFARWGALPGAYVQPGERDFNSSRGSKRIVGGKPLESMISIVADYSRPGDLVVDPCSGGGTTGMAARMCGRRYVGIERDPGRAQQCANVLAATPYVGAIPYCRPSRLGATQMNIGFELDHDRSEV